jgi:hypothetical protein
MKKDDIGHLEITRYNWELVDGEPKIVIHQVKALDKNGKYIKFVKLEKVVDYLFEFDVVFKRQLQ